MTRTPGYFPPPTEARSVRDAHAYDEQTESRSLRTEPECGRENNEEFRFKLKFKCN